MFSRPLKDQKMSAVTPRTKPTRPYKMTSAEKTKAILRLRRRLEDSLSVYNHYAERRFIVATIDLLYCFSSFDRDVEAIIVGLSKLTQKGRLRDIFSRSTTDSQNGRVRFWVRSPSEERC
jgi:hypothetical protein